LNSFSTFTNIIVTIALLFFIIQGNNHLLFSKIAKKDSLEVVKFKADSIQVALIKEEKRKARTLRKQVINKSKNILIIGFNLKKNNSKKNKNSKYLYLAKAYEKYLKENLKNNKYKIDIDKSDKLQQNYIQTNSLFLSSREIYKNYTDYNFNSSIQGSFEIRGKVIKLNIEIYSNHKNRIIFKDQFKGQKSELLTFFHNVTQTIFNKLKYDIIPENIFPIDNNSVFYKYLTLIELQKRGKYESVFDTLEDLELAGKLSNYPILLKMYESVKLKGINENQIGKYIGNLFENNNFYKTDKNKSSTKTKTEPKDTESFVKQIIRNGYKFILKSDILNIDKEDTTRANLIVDFQVKLKKAYRSKLLRRINREKGDKRWRNMGRYYFSSDDDKNDDFVSTLKDQIFKLTIYDSNDKELLEEEITIDLIDFEGGIYENLKKDPIFPLNPISPTINGFRITKRINAVFVFEDVDMEIIRNISKSKIEIIFE